MSRRRISIKTALASSIPDGAQLLVCVSGGRDSMVMLNALVGLQRLKKIGLTVCHIDHGLREDSHRDADFVSSHCIQGGIECVVKRLERKPSKVNTESWARERRYEIFASLLVERRLDLFLTAHTANDVAETLLMRLLANKELNTIEVSDPERGCLRPLLNISRSQINDYVKRYGVKYVEDPSNSSTQLVRNRIRLNVLPFLEREFDESLVWTLSEQAHSLAEDVKALQRAAEELARPLLPADANDNAWRFRCKKALRGLPYAIQWRLIEVLLREDLGFLLGERRSSAIVAALLGLGPEVRVRQDLVIAQPRQADKRCLIG